ncbi:MAG TPA: enoyl-CoA hydratase/isomerase family protein [Chloroflexota bacterium]|nr:enoyl-CoA hydratase/isomerase family protein [Chloroflexota bacterium]
MALVELSRDGKVATLTLNNPRKRNPLSTAVVVELTKLLRECDADERIGCVILTGAGESFCAGADLQEFLDSIDAGSVEHWASGEPWGDLFRLVPSMAKPVVASVRGHALAGGCGLVALCDLAVAAEDATFGTPEINIGLFPLFIFPALIRAVGRRNAMALCLSGRSIDAAEAQRMGLVNTVVPLSELEQFTVDLANGLAEKPPRAMRLGKHAFYRMAELDYDSGIDFARSIRGAFLGGDELREGTKRFLKKQKPSR